jgi:hypothetical protein
VRPIKKRAREKTKIKKPAFSGWLLLIIVKIKS